MDVIALHRAGFATAVAPLGTALTEAQLQELWRLSPEPVLCFDGDTAGQRAALRALHRRGECMSDTFGGLKLPAAAVGAGELPGDPLLTFLLPYLKAVVPALLTKSEQATGTLSLVFFPIAFMSTAFVPPALMPGWLQTVNSWNPITFLIEAIRPLMVSGYDWAAIGKALIAIAVLGLVLQSATLWAFRRLTA